MSGTPYADGDDLATWARQQMEREPDFLIGEPSAPYMRRWWIVPRNRMQNVYLHEILRSDTDEALHDHPFDNTSLLIVRRGDSEQCHQSAARHPRPPPGGRCPPARRSRGRARGLPLRDRSGRARVGLPLPTGLATLARLRRRRAEWTDGEGLR